MTGSVDGQKERRLGRSREGPRENRSTSLRICQKSGGESNDNDDSINSNNISSSNDNDDNDNDD